MPQPELDEIASVVAMAVESALSGLREKFAASEARVIALDGTVSDLRARLAASEAKSAPAVDTKVYERLAVAESKAARLDEAEKRLGELSDRLLTWETKSATEPETDIRDHLVALSPVQERVATCEARLDALAESQKALDAVKDRVAAVEARPETVARVEPDAELRERVGSITSVTEALKADVARVEKRVVELDQKHAGTVESVSRDLSAVRERVAVAEVRAFTPGPAGAAGRDGHDGVDGVSYDELTATLEHDRTIVLRAAKGDRVKEVGSLTVPFMIFRGTWVEKDYEPGDVVNWAGSGWHCQAPTKAKPGESPDWKLFVKRGQDGKDAGETGRLPNAVVRVR